MSKKAKAERCVKKLKGTKSINPYAICRASTGFKGSFGKRRKRRRRK